MPELPALLGVAPDAASWQLAGALERCHAALLAQARAGDAVANKRLLDLRLAYLCWACAPRAEAAGMRSGGGQR